MKLSVFSIVDDVPGRNRYDDILELAVAADEAGLSALWVAEHHFNPAGVCPSPPVLLAACGVRTRRLRLGALVSVLPFHRPVDVAEEYSLLDRVVGGRVNLGLGSGYIPTEFEGYGIDPASRHERFDAAYSTILDLMAGREARIGGPSAPRVRLNVLPVQAPHPPLWIAVQRREAIPFVARRGVSVALIPYATLSGVPELAEEVREFRAALPVGSKAEVAVGVHLYAGDHPERGREALDRFLSSRLRTQSTFYQAKTAQHPHQASRAGLEESNLALLGTPAEVTRRLEPYRAAGVDEVLGIFDFGGLPIADAVGSIRSLGRAFVP
ncbi:MAG: LLM class flavin-dependent oxidoreductase [Thermoplasmata archaeon]